MSDVSLFSGRVRLSRLPVFTEPTGPAAPTLKRLLLPQGELAQFHDQDPGLRYLACIELRTGAIRGNHFHRAKQELIYVIHGSLDLLVAEIPPGNASLPAGSGSAQMLRIQAGELVQIEPGIAHALHTVTPGFAIEGSPQRFDPADTYRHPLTRPEAAS